MDGVGLAAVITACTATLGVISGGIVKVHTMIMDAYKRQVEATETAKNGEIAALNARVERQTEQAMRQSNTIASHEATIATLRNLLAALGGQS